MCDTVVVVGADGVLFAKNSDRDPNEAQLVEWHPASDHPPDSLVRVTWMEVPQTSHTYAVVLSRPFWMWGAEMGANEHGVVAGNEAVFTDQPYEEVGLTGMDLLRLGLERGRTAAEAVSVIVELLERFGQGGGCGLERPSFSYHNSFIVADPEEAYVLETAGRHWATEQVTGGARSISNGLTIPAFAEAHTDPLRTKMSACRIRRARTEAAASRATGPGDLFGVLRDHGETPRYRLLTGGMESPCMHAGGVLTSSQTTASWVSDLRTGLHWVTATAAPCTSLFKPVRVDEPVDLGPYPTDRFRPDSYWWRHEIFHRRALRDPESTFPRFGPERDTVERDWLADPPPAAAAFELADRLVRSWDERIGPVADRRPWWVRCYWARRDRWAGLADRARRRAISGR